MDRIKNVLFYNMKSNKQKILFSFIINFLFSLGFLLFCNLSYEMGDDALYTTFVSADAYDSGFSNYFIMLFIGVLQKCIYPVNSYIVVSLFFSFSAFFAITRVFIDKFSVLPTSIITVLLYAFLGINHFATISFTRNPAIISVAGFLCIIHFSKQKKWVAGTVLGSLLVIVAAMFRFTIFEVACVFVAAFIVTLSLRDVLREKKDNNFKRLIIVIFEPKRLLAIIITVIICFSVTFVSSNINTSTPQQKYYRTYTSARSAVWDYEIPDYDECKEEYDKIGIDENDIKMLRLGYMDDGGAFNIEKLTEIKSIKKSVDDKKISFIPMIKKMFVTELGYIKGFGDRGIILVAFGMLFLFYCIVLRKRNLPIVLIMVPLIIGFYLYLNIIGRVVFRAVYILWVSSIIYAIYAIEPSEIRTPFKNIYKKKKITSYLISGALLLFITLYGFYGSYIGNNTMPRWIKAQDKQTVKNLYSYLKTQKGKKYEISRSFIRLWNVPDNMYIIQNDKNPNYKEFHCVYYKYPKDIRDMEKILNTDNMFSNLFSENVFFVDNKEAPVADSMQKYLQKYYSESRTVVMEKTDEFEGNDIIKYSLK